MFKRCIMKPVSSTFVFSYLGSSCCKIRRWLSLQASEWLSTLDCGTSLTARLKFHCRWLLVKVIIYLSLDFLASCVFLGQRRKMQDELICNWKAMKSAIERIKSNTFVFGGFRVGFPRERSRCPRLWSFWLWNVFLDLGAATFVLPGRQNYFCIAFPVWFLFGELRAAQRNEAQCRRQPLVGGRGWVRWNGSRFGRRPTLLRQTLEPSSFPWKTGIAEPRGVPSVRPTSEVLRQAFVVGERSVERGLGNDIVWTGDFWSDLTEILSCRAPTNCFMSLINSFTDWNWRVQWWKYLVSSGRLLSCAKGFIVCFKLESLSWQ